MHDVAVIGAGVIGLTVARQLHADGRTVVVVDPDPSRAASEVAAGMLAPGTEARTTEAALHELSLASLRRWPSFAASLEAETGMAVGLRSEGTLAVGVDADDLRAVAEAAAVAHDLGVAAERLTSRQARHLEPALTPRLAGGFVHADERSVDNRALLAALRASLRRRDLAVVARAATAVGKGSVTCDDGSTIAAGDVVVTAGCWSGRLRIEGLDAVPVRPVKGQLLRLHAPGVLTRTVRAVASGRHVYLVPREGGELVVGATMEEQGFDRTTTVGACHDLLRAALAVVPDLAEAELREVCAGLRPATPDNGPLLGTVADGVHLAVGHHRNGILLAPETAAILAGALRGEQPTAFRADRFQGASVG